jgi:putative ABC transport system ATP-binding protein
MFIELAGVSKRYAAAGGPVAALTDVSLWIARGAAVAVVGPSGSGKTTLLAILGGIDRATTGTVRVNGADLTTMSPRLLARFRRAHVGFIFQANNLVDVLSARENIALPLGISGLQGRERRRRVDALIDELGLGAVAGRRPPELSGGQQQRVGIARALVTEPALVLADEPTAHLDAGTAAEVMTTLRALQERRGTTLVFSTHDPAMEALAGQRCALQSGRVVAGCAPEEKVLPCEIWCASPSVMPSAVLAVP